MTESDQQSLFLHKRIGCMAFHQLRRGVRGTISVIRQEAGRPSFTAPPGKGDKDSDSSHSTCFHWLLQNVALRRLRANVKPPKGYFRPSNELQFAIRAPLALTRRSELVHRDASQRGGPGHCAW